MYLSNGCQNPVKVYLTIFVDVRFGKKREIRRQLKGNWNFP